MKFRSKEDLEIWLKIFEFGATLYDDPTKPI
jgi:hypothetical protein